MHDFSAKIHSLLSRPFAPGLAAFLLYALSGARTIQWQDSAQFTYRIGSGTLWNEYGLAMVHPFHFWAGRLMLRVFPGPDPWAVSLVSALGGAVAVGLLFACMRRLSSHAGTAWFAALTLMLAHSFWRFSGIPEVYSWSAALLMGEVWCYLRLQQSNGPRWWWSLFWLNGVALSNHNMALLSLPVWGLSFIIWCYKKPGRWRHLAAIGICWLMGSWLYFFIIGLEIRSGQPLPAVLHSALFGEGFRDQVTGISPQLKYTMITLGFMLLSFPGLALPLALRQFFSQTRGKTKLPWPVLWICLLHLLFFLRYNVIDQYTFLLPAYTLIAMMAGLGFAQVTKPALRRLAFVLLALQPCLYAAFPTLARKSGVLAGFERHKPYRDDYRYLFWPWSRGERSAERLMQEAFDAVGASGQLIVEDDMAYYSAAWMRLNRGLERSVQLLRPEDQWVLPVDAAAVWIPARDDLPPVEGWQSAGAVWRRDPGEFPPVK